MSYRPNQIKHICSREINRRQIRGAWQRRLWCSYSLYSVRKKWKNQFLWRFQTCCARKIDDSHTKCEMQYISNSEMCFIM